MRLGNMPQEMRIINQLDSAISEWLIQKKLAFTTSKFTNAGPLTELCLQSRLIDFADIKQQSFLTCDRNTDLCVAADAGKTMENVDFRRKKRDQKHIGPHFDLG